jgi:transposase
LHKSSGTDREGINANFLLVDKGYDSNEIVKLTREIGMIPVIAPRNNRTKTPRQYDKELYKYRHLVENTFLKMKQRRAIASPYAKNLSSFNSIVQICCIMLWLKIS